MAETTTATAPTPEATAPPLAAFDVETPEAHVARIEHGRTLEAGIRAAAERVATATDASAKAAAEADFEALSNEHFKDYAADHPDRFLEKSKEEIEEFREFHARGIVVHKVLKGLSAFPDPETILPPDKIPHKGKWLGHVRDLRGHSEKVVKALSRPKKPTAAPRRGGSPTTAPPARTPEGHSRFARGKDKVKELFTAPEPEGRQKIPEDGKWTIATLEARGNATGNPELDQALADLSTVGEELAKARSRVIMRTFKYDEITKLEARYTAAKNKVIEKGVDHFRATAEAGPDYEDRLLRQVGGFAVAEQAWHSERVDYHAQRTLRGKILGVYNRSGLVGKIGFGVAVGAATAGLSLATGGTAAIGLGLAGRGLSGTIRGAAKGHAKRTAAQAGLTKKYAEQAGASVVEWGRSSGLTGWADLAEFVEQASKAASAGERKERFDLAKHDARNTLLWTLGGAIAGKALVHVLSDGFGHFSVDKTVNKSAVTRPSVRRHLAPKAHALVEKFRAQGLSENKIHDIVSRTAPANYDTVSDFADRVNASAIRDHITTTEAYEKVDIFLKSVREHGYEKTVKGIQAYAELNHTPAFPAGSLINAGDHYIGVATAGARTEWTSGIAEAALRQQLGGTYLEYGYSGQEPSYDQIRELATVLLRKRKLVGLPGLLRTGERVSVTKQEILDAIARAAKKAKLR